MKVDKDLITLLRLYKSGDVSEETLISIINRDYEAAEALGHGKGVIETLKEQLLKNY